MLCDPSVYDGRQPVLFTRPTPTGEIVTIQHFSVDYDLEELQREFLEQTRPFDLDGLLEQFKTSFHYMAGSNTSQAFIVSLDAAHLFELEVHQATAHPTLLPDLTLQPGDYILQLSAGQYDKNTPDRYALALNSCAQFFFTFAEVRRLLLDTRLFNPSEIFNILYPAGFLPLPNFKSVYHTTKDQQNGKS